MKIVIDSASPWGASVRHDSDFLSHAVFELNKMDEFDLVVLDRGNINLPHEIALLPFPAYSPSRFNAEDSILLQKICNHLGAELFVSEISTPLTTPMLLILRDVVQHNILSSRTHMEIDLAITYADAIICEKAEDESKIRRRYPVTTSKILSNTQKLSSFFLNFKGCKSSDGQFISNALMRREWSKFRTIQSRVDAVIWDESEV